MDKPAEDASINKRPREVGSPPAAPPDDSDLSSKPRNVAAKYATGRTSLSFAFAITHSNNETVLSNTMENSFFFLFFVASPHF